MANPTTLKQRCGTLARGWGFRTQTGARSIAPRRARGLVLSRKVDTGGDGLLAMAGATIVRSGGNRLHLGRAVQLQEHVRLVFEGPAGAIDIGDDTFVNARSEIRAREHVRIGARCMLAFDVVVMDTNHHDLDGTTTTEPTTVGDDVWIGARAMVM
jgi:acetyltransferase-like isoleucine patch superfamily enzyme